MDNSSRLSDLQELVSRHGDTVLITQEYDLQGSPQDTVTIYRDWSIGGLGFWIYYNLDGGDGSIFFYNSWGHRMRPSLSSSTLRRALGFDRISDIEFVIKLYKSLASGRLILITSRKLGVLSWDLLLDGRSIRLAYNENRGRRL